MLHVHLRYYLISSALCLGIAIFLFTRTPIFNQISIAKGEAISQSRADAVSAICFAPAPQNYHDVCTKVVIEQLEFLADLSNYDVAVVGMGPTLFGSIAAEVDAFVSSGGGLVAVFPYSEPGPQPLPPGFEVTVTEFLWPGAPEVPPPTVEVTQAGDGHPILAGVSLDSIVSDVDVIGVAPIDSLGAEWTLLAKSQGYEHAALAVGNYGAGRIVLTGISVASDANGLKLMGQMVTWAGQEGSPAPTPSPTPPSPTPTATPSGPDMQINAIEVTQAIQDLNNSVDLIAKKRTYVRVHVSASTTVRDVVANLEVMRDGSPLSPTLIPGNPGGDITLGTSSDRGQINDSFWFEIPTEWVDAGEVMFTATVDPNNTKEDPNLANNQKTVTTEFFDAPPLPLRLYNVQYTIDGATYKADEFHLERAESWLRRAFPISELRVKRTDFIYPEDGAPTLERLISWLEVARWLTYHLSIESADTYHYGLLDDGGVTINGGAKFIPGRVGAGPTGPTGINAPKRTQWDKDGSYGDWVMGHEVAHLIGRFHADFCGVGANNSVAPYPHRLGRISPTTKGNSAIYGFDIETKKIYDPNWKDLMTYCDYKWVSDFTYEGIREEMAAASAANASTVDAEKFLIVSGIVDSAGSTISLLNIQLIEQTSTLQLPQPGDWSIVLLDSTDNELADYPFAVEKLIDEDDEPRIPALISEVVPWVDGAVKVEIRNGAQVVTTKSASVNAPTLSITVPSQGQTFDDGPIQFEWTGADADQDALTYSVLYRHSTDSNWEVLTTNLVTPTLTVDASLLPGGSTSYLQILASDGFLTGAEIVGPFSVAASKPVAKIESPVEDGATFVPGQLITLQGNGYDPEDGQLAGVALTWMSNIDGNLGTGALLHRADLSTGNHTITLTATDSDGSTGQTQRTFSILTGTEAEPDQLNIAPFFHEFVAQIGETAEISTTLTIRNMGNAALDWGASKDAAWLSLSESVGTTPSGLTVTVDPTGLTLGTHRGVVTLAAGESSVQVPIVVEIVEAGAAGTPEVLYLPLVQR